MPLKIVSDDITKLTVDAIVNAANENLAPGGGICGAIFQGAGMLLANDCQKVGHCDVGDAVITFAYKLPSKYVIHAVGPVWRGGSYNEPVLLSSAYAKSLELASVHNCKTVAFPLISSGIYGYPKDLAFHEAVTTIGNYLLNDENLEVFLSIYPPAVIGMEPDLKAELAAWLPVAHEAAAFSPKEPPDATIAQPTFKSTIQNLMRVHNFSIEELSRRANLAPEDLKPDAEGVPSSSLSKKVVLSIALALALDNLETQNLLAQAGYSLDPFDKTDQIVVFFHQKGISDVYLVSEALFANGQPFLNA